MPKSSLLWDDGEVLDNNDEPEYAQAARCQCGSVEFLFYKALGCDPTVERELDSLPTVKGG